MQTANKKVVKSVRICIHWSVHDPYIKQTPLAATRQSRPASKGSTKVNSGFSSSHSTQKLCVQYADVMGRSQPKTSTENLFRQNCAEQAADLLERGQQLALCYLARAHSLSSPTVFSRSHFLRVYKKTAPVFRTHQTYGPTKLNQVLGTVGVVQKNSANTGSLLRLLLFRHFCTLLLSSIH